MDDLIFGKTWNEIQAMQQKTYCNPTINLSKPGDYGCDPVGNGTFKMVPSGEIVSFDEMKKRLNH